MHSLEVCEGMLIDAQQNSVKEYSTSISDNQMKVKNLHLKLETNSTKVPSLKINNHVTAIQASRLNNRPESKEMPSGSVYSNDGHSSRMETTQLSGSSRMTAANVSEQFLDRSDFRTKNSNVIADSSPSAFAAQIKEYIRSDRIHLVVDRIRSVLDQEKVDLTRRIKQLESFMESDCEVIVTNRSSSKSTPTKSLSRRDSRVDEFYGTADYDGISPECELCGGKISDQEITLTQRSAQTSARNIRIENMQERSDFKQPDALCLDCRARSSGGMLDNSHILDNRMRSNTNNSSSSSISSSSRSMRSSSSTMVGNIGKIKSTERSSTPVSISRTHSSSSSQSLSGPLRRSYGEDMPFSSYAGVKGRDAVSKTDSITDGVPKPGTSKFRNRLQAARDEHHFLADDYSIR